MYKLFCINYFIHYKQRIKWKVESETLSFLRVDDLRCFYAKGHLGEQRAFHNGVLYESFCNIC